MRDYKSLVQRRKAEWGKKFSSRNLAKKFIPAYESGRRIRVKFHTGEVLSGTVGCTTGWRPAFLLMLTSRSHGSSWTLSGKDRIVSDKTPIKRY